RTDKNRALKTLCLRVLLQPLEVGRERGRVFRAHRPIAYQYDDGFDSAWTVRERRRVEYRVVRNIDFQHGRFGTSLIPVILLPGKSGGKDAGAIEIKDVRIARPIKPDFDAHVIADAEWQRSFVENIQAVGCVLLLPTPNVQLGFWWPDFNNWWGRIYNLRTAPF